MSDDNLRPRESWESIRSAAWWRFNHSEQLPPCLSDNPQFHGKPRIRIWDDAGGYGCPYEPMTLTIYEVYMNDGYNRIVLRQAVWQRTNDLHLHMFSNPAEQANQSRYPSPSIRICDCEVPWAELHSLMVESASLHVPLTSLEKFKSVSSNPGAAGFEYYCADGPPAVLRLQWSHETPSAWEPALAWIAKLRGFLEACIPEHGRAQRVTEPQSFDFLANPQADPDNPS